MQMAPVRAPIVIPCHVRPSSRTGRAAAVATVTGRRRVTSSSCRNGGACAGPSPRRLHLVGVQRRLYVQHAANMAAYQLAHDPHNKVP